MKKVFLIIFSSIYLYSSDTYCSSSDDLEKYYVFYENNLYLYESFKDNPESIQYLIKANYFGLLYASCKEKLVKI